MVINRAAWTLNNLNAVEAVPALIRALLTYEQQIVMVPPNNGSPARSAACRWCRSRVNNGGAAFMTPPVVGQGVVAFGTVSTPAYGMPGLGLTTGGQINTQPEPRVVTFTYREHGSSRRLAKAHGPGLRLRRRRLARVGQPGIQSDPQAGAPGSATVSGHGDRPRPDRAEQRLSH